MNAVSIVGRLTRDPELRHTKSGTSVLTGRLAFTRREKRGQEWEDVPGYVDVTLGWGARAESLERLLRKGTRIGVTGELRYREWETPDGGKRSALDIAAGDVFLLDNRNTASRPAAGTG